MGFFDGGNALQIAKQAREDRRAAHRAYQNQLLIWDAMLFPEKVTRILDSNDLRVDPRWRQLAKDTSRVVLEWPRTRANAYHNRLTRAQSIIEIASVDDPVEDLKVSRLEEVLFGLLNMLDDTVVSSGGMDHSWDSMYKKALIRRGKVIGRPHLRETYPGSGQAMFECPIFNPYSFYHDFEGHPKLFMNEYQVRRDHLDAFVANLDPFAKAGIPQRAMSVKDTGFVTITDIMVEEPDPDSDTGELRVLNAMLVETPDGGLDGTPATEAVFEDVFYKTPFKHSPYVIMSMHSDVLDFYSKEDITNNSLTLGGGRDLVRHAEPFFAPAEDALKALSAAYGLEYDSLVFKIHADLLETIPAESGDEPIDQEAVGPGGIHRVEPGHTISAIDRGGQTLYQFKAIDAMMEELESIFPSTLVRALATPALSGFAINSIQDHNENILIPGTRAAAVFKERVLREALHQWQDEKNSKLELGLQWRSIRGERAGHMMMGTFKVSDLPKSYMINVDEPPEVPWDAMRAANTFTILTQGDRPGMSQSTAMSRILKIQDVPGEQRRIRQEQIARIPKLVMGDAIRGLYDKLRLLRAEMTQTTNPVILASIQIEETLLLNEIKRLEQEASGGQPPASLPVAAGPAPEASPPEEGPMNPDIAALVQGQAPGALA